MIFFEEWPFEELVIVKGIVNIFFSWVKVWYQSVSELILFEFSVGFVNGQVVNKVESFQLVFFKQDGEGSLKKIYSFLQVNYIKDVVHCLLHLISLLWFRPIRVFAFWYAFVYQLGKECFEAEWFTGSSASKVLLGKFELVENSSKNNHEEKQTNHSLKYSSNVRQSVKMFEIGTFMDNCFHGPLEVD